MKKFINIRKINNLKLRYKLILSYILLISIPSLTTGLIYYKKSSQIIFDNSQKSIYEIVKKNNKIIDIKLSKVEQSSQIMAIDKGIFEIISRGKPEGDDKLVQDDIKLSEIIRSYFPGGQDEYSVYLATDYYIYGINDNMFIPKNAFIDSFIYKKALEAKGKLEWIPTYDFTDTYNLNNLKQVKLDYNNIFSAVKTLNCSMISSVYTYGGSFIINGLKPNIKKPVLIINYRENLYRDIFLDSVPFKESSYYIIDKDGHIISQTDPSKIGKTEMPIWLDEAIKKKTGINNFEINGRKYLVCYDTSKVTGWISASIIPNDRILNSLPTIINYTLLFCIMLTIISIILSYVLSGLITNPIKKLITGIKGTSKGDFENKIEVTSEDEIGVLVRNYNEMNEKISLLIQENYEVKIRQNKAEIMALNLQLNPHFMSNTLNIINWMAIEGGQEEISKMILSLSSMLRYTMRNTEELVLFKYDIEWLKNYAYIMSNRYEGLFIVIYDLDLLLYETSVPKLFLQPFVENSIIHAFNNIDNGGEIKISGWIHESNRYFCIEDNGNGISKAKIDKIKDGDNESIGIMNIDKRIKLIYGISYGVQIESHIGMGTKIIISMPYKNER